MIQLSVSQLHKIDKSTIYDLDENFNGPWLTKISEPNNGKNWFTSWPGLCGFSSARCGTNSFEKFREADDTFPGSEYIMTFC